MSASERLVFGCIAAAFGAVVGVAVAVVFLVFGAAHGQFFNVRVVLFSIVYFFAVGAWRGAAAGEVFARARRTSSPSSPRPAM